MIFVIERFNLKWESGEKQKFKINYINWKGDKRSYYPDFLIEERYLIEIKPKKLWNSDSVKRKKAAAKIWCKENGYLYKMISCTTIIDFYKIKELIKNNDLKFTNRYLTKFNNLL